MTRRIHALLLSGCFVVAVLQAPIALRSVSEVWSGPYAAPEMSLEVAQPTASEAGEELAEEPQLAMDDSVALAAGI